MNRLALLALALLASLASASASATDDRPRPGACLAASPGSRCYVALQADGPTREVASDGIPLPASRRAADRQAFDRHTFDRDGNAVDRRGRILAVPGAAGRPDEVFIDD